MKVILATPIYPPKVGGPAQYVKNLAEKLNLHGIKTEVISYAGLEKYPQPLRFFLYFRKLFSRASKGQIIYAFNLVSTGLPAYAVSKIRRKKFIIRIGGDFLWERAVQSGKTQKPLREYYREPKRLIERAWMFMIKVVLGGADKVVLTGNFLRKVYIKHFNLADNKIAVILNPFPAVSLQESEPPVIGYQLLYAGRLLKAKNLDTLIEVFKEVSEKSGKYLTLKIIGEGPEKPHLEWGVKYLKLENKVLIQRSLPHRELLKEIKKSYLCILPALTDITPNFVLECVRLRKPILLTKETEYYETMRPDLIFIDPEDKNDIEAKILHLLKENNYRAYVERLKNIPVDFSWERVVLQHISLLKELMARR